jgi:antirestriction protein ArdC
MSEVQNVKTLIHEMAHAKLHNMTAQKARDDGGQTRSSKEVEAESVAYTVCQHYGIDTSDYSFAYVAGWSGGKRCRS